MMCGKCSRIMGILLLIFGVIFLLQNINVWDFWNIQWYTMAFLLIGLCGVCMSGCSDCGPKK